MPAPTNAIPPMTPIPPTKAAHKQALFDSCKALVGLALRYTMKYTYDPEELDFIDFLNDVIKTLPMDERTVPMCASVFYVPWFTYRSNFSVSSQTTFVSKHGKQIRVRADAFLCHVP
jgi:hypothetical protein